MSNKSPSSLVCNTVVIIEWKVWSYYRNEKFDKYTSRDGLFKLKKQRNKRKKIETFLSQERRKF